MTPCKGRGERFCLILINTRIALRHRSPFPDDSIRDAVLTESPNRQNLGIVIPITPDTHVPEWTPGHNDVNAKTCVINTYNYSRPSHMNQRSKWIYIIMSCIKSWIAFKLVHREWGVSYLCALETGTLVCAALWSWWQRWGCPRRSRLSRRCVGQRYGSVVR